MWVFAVGIEHVLDVAVERPHDAAVLSVIAAFVRRFEQIERSVDLGNKALDLVALAGVGTISQPFEQLLLSRKEVGQRCHRGVVSRGGRRQPSHAAPIVPSRNSGGHPRRAGIVDVPGLRAIVDALAGEGGHVRRIAGMVTIAVLGDGRAPSKFRWRRKAGRQQIQ
jgi:hypothetical protein